MPPVRQPASAVRDRAERRVFELLPELGAAERRALALVELADVALPAAARDLGIEEGTLVEALAAGRKALRRGRVALAGGLRCERAERLHSASLDAPLARAERKWLEIHLARCPRCIEHADELAGARAELRSSFAEAPPALPAAPEPAALPEGRARLRVVPAPPEPAPAPALGDRIRPMAGLDSPHARRAAKIVAIVAVILAMLLGLGLGIDALSGP